MNNDNSHHQNHSNQGNRVENDIADIKQSQKRLEDALMGSIVNGTPTIGLFEQVRGQGEEIKELKTNYISVNELNKTVENLYRWKYLIVGGFLVAIFFIDRIFTGLITMFDGFLNKK